MKLQVGHVELRQFSPRDMRELYCIRNHESVRQFMSRPSLIPYRSHVQWVNSELIGNSHFLLFLVRTGTGRRAVGLTQLRLTGAYAEIGVMFREASAHQTVTSVSTVIMLHLAFELLQLKGVLSYVIASNAAAIRFNKAFGAGEEQPDRPGMVKLRLTRDVCLGNQNYKRILDRIKSRLKVELS